MKEEFSPQEKEAVLSVLFVLVHADYRFQSDEHASLKQCVDSLGVDFETFIPIPQNQLEVRAYSTLRKLSKEKKREFARMITKIARSDGNFGPLERAYSLEIMEMCEIPFVHR